MKVENDIFEVKLPQAMPKCGDILVAEPSLSESYFDRAVIAIIENNENGTAMGIVLNKQTRFSLQEAVSDINYETPIPLFCGGPLATDRLFIIHTLGSVISDSEELVPGFYFGGEFNEIKAYIESGNVVEGKIRFFMGYSGWEKNQLKDELENHVWVVSSMHRNCTEYIQGSESEYWRSVVRELDDAYRQWLLYPEYPELN